MGGAGNNLAPTDTPSRSFTQRMQDMVKGCFYPDPAKVEEPVVYVQVLQPQATVMATLVPEKPLQAKVVTEKPLQAKVVTEKPPKAPAIYQKELTDLKDWCDKLIKFLNDDLDKNYLRIKHLDLILPGSRDAQFDEAFKVATILAKAGKIRYFLGVAMLSDSEIDSFRKICRTIYSEYQKMEYDKSRSSNTKASPKEISWDSQQEYAKLKHGYLDTPKCHQIIQRNIEQSLEQISVTDVANNDEKYKKHCKMVAYNILLEKLLNNESGPYSIYYLDKKDGKNTPEHLENARRYHRIKACEKVQTVHKEVTSETAVREKVTSEEVREKVLKRIREDIKCLYMACMLTYTNLDKNGSIILE